MTDMPKCCTHGMLKYFMHEMPDTICKIRMPLEDVPVLPLLS